MNDVENLTQVLLNAARQAGAQAADAMAVSVASLSVEVRQNHLEHAERSESVEIGLRVIVEGKQACVSASDASAETIKRLAERAVAMATEALVDPYVGLADPAHIATSWDLAALEIADSVSEPSALSLQETALEIESAAAAQKGISQVQTSAAYERTQAHLAATNGFSGGYERTSYSLSALAYTGDGTGMERDWASEGRTFFADMPEPRAIGLLAAERTLARVGSRQPKSGHFPVLFDERVSSSLIGHLLSAINGAAIARGSSWLLNGIGRSVLPKGVFLLDDALRPRASASRPFDAEGLASMRRIIVDDGILQGWTLDLATGRQLGMPSTASASRGVSTSPSPATSNIDLTQGSYSREDLIAQMGTGLIVTSMIGSTINATTGDYSRGASGFWVENGHICYPVNGCTIAGNLRDMLLNITSADDARAHLSMRVPSLLVDGMIIAAK